MKHPIEKLLRRENSFRENRRSLRVIDGLYLRDRNCGVVYNSTGGTFSGPPVKQESKQASKQTSDRRRELEGLLR